MITYLVLLLYLQTTSSLNVLIWSPTFGYSHVAFMSNIADILVEDGHNVTMFLLEYDPSITGNDSGKAQSVLRYPSPLTDPMQWQKLHWLKPEVFEIETFKFVDVLFMESFQLKLCRNMLEDTHFLDHLKSGQFDIAVVELFHFCPIGILHLVGIPKVVLASSLGITPTHYYFFNAPISLSNTPALGTNFGSKMDFFQRFHNVLTNFACQFFMWRMLGLEQKLFEEKHPGFPILSNLGQRKIDYALLNANEFTESTRTTINAFRYIGGSAIYPPNPLTDNFESILSASHSGVIIFSMGSIIKSSFYPKWFEEALMTAFQHFPEYIFLWKHEGKHNTVTKNIVFKKWIPQTSLLADKRVKGFISHAGPNSIIESVHYGKPMILIPMFWDQNWNAAIAEERGYAIRLSKFSMTSVDVIKALTLLLRPNSSLAETAKDASKILQGESNRMRNDIKRTIRLSGERKTPLTHLKLTSNLSFIAYYNLDVYFSIFITFTVLMTICLYGIYKLFFVNGNHHVKIE